MQLTLKSSILDIDEENRIFRVIATSEVVDTQSEIVDMKSVEDILPLLKSRGAAVNLGHFGINVGEAKDFEIKTFGQIREEFPDLKELDEYDPATKAVLGIGRIRRGSKYDDLAWDLLKSGDITGVSFGGVTQQVPSVKCDAKKCGKVIRVTDAFFEIALTSPKIKSLFPNIPNDLMKRSENPSNPTAVVVALKSENNTTMEASTQKMEDPPKEETQQDLTSVLQSIMDRLDALEARMQPEQKMEDKPEEKIDPSENKDCKCNPSMKSTVTIDQIAELLDKQEAKLEQKIYEKIGLKAVTPVSMVDAQQPKQQRTLQDAVKHFSEQGIIPQTDDILEYLSG